MQCCINVAGSSQVITDMDKVTQQNGALVQQAASASGSMRANAVSAAPA